MVHREAVLAAAHAALVLGCPGVAVFRNRRSEIDVGSDGADGQAGDPGECPALNFLDGGHTASYENTGMVNYSMRASIDGFVTAPSDLLLGPVVNELYGQVLRAVMADVSLDGLSINVREVGFDVRAAPVAESARAFADFTVEIEIDFETPDLNANA